MEPPPEPPEVAHPAPPPSALRPWAAASLMLTYRPRLDLAPQLTVQAGALTARGAALGLGLELPYTREVVGTVGSLRTWELVARGSWSPSWRVAPELGVAAGFSRRTWAQADEELHGGLIPVASAEAGVALRIHPALSVLGAGRASVELGQTRVKVVGGTPWVLSPWQGEVEIALRAQRP